ncbi:UNVERIFIED_CONTAM: hypothetical protein RMT77_008865 [Armadillidium vulgare]
MTVTYTSEVATAKKFGIFWKLLFRWKGSIYRLIWPEICVFITLYYTLRFVYDYALNKNQRQIFEDISLYCQNFTDMIPLTFVLGFYVSIVMARWWDQYKTIPWPDNLAVFVSTSIHGLDERGRLMRRTIMRYVNLSFVMTMSMISPMVKKRFPTYEHMVEAGFLTKNEKKIFENLDEMYPQPKYWMPLVWAGTIASRARKEGRIRDDFGVKTILDTINVFRASCGALLGYDTISVPLVYTQVVTLATYTFFMGTLMARQHLDPSKGYPKNTVDLFFPYFTILQFLFYMGWLKVAETLINPFGEDDDDFAINVLIDRDLQTSYLIVDGMHSEHPEMIQDKYWDEGIPQDLPYTIATEQSKIGPYLGSTACIEVPQNQQFFLRPVPECNDDDEEGSEVGLKTPGLRKRTHDKPDAELGNILKFDSTNNKDTGDEESVLWVTPKSIPKNPSILSFFKQTRRLSRQVSSTSGLGSSRELNHPVLKKAESIKSTRSPKPSKRYLSEKRDESTLFRLSLESLKEEDQNKSDSEDENFSLLPRSKTMEQKHTLESKFSPETSASTSITTSTLTPSTTTTTSTTAI